jgi:hypothetical protein
MRGTVNHNGGEAVNRTDNKRENRLSQKAMCQSFQREDDMQSTLNVQSVNRYLWSAHYSNGYMQNTKSYRSRSLPTRPY